MPGGDGSGPQGLGPMTGRAAGFCAGYGVAGYANPWPRGGWGGRGGRGRGWRAWGAGFGARRGVAPVAGVVPVAPAPAVAPVPAESGIAEELDALRRQTANLVGALDAIASRLEALESRQKAE